MNTIKAIALGFFSLLAIAGADAQVMIKPKKEKPQFYADPKMKIKDIDDGRVIIKDKGYGGYFRNRPYYYDVERHLYYYVYNGRKIYYRKGWIPD